MNFAQKKVHIKKKGRIYEFSDKGKVGRIFSLAQNIVY